MQSGEQGKRDPNKSQQMLWKLGNGKRETETWDEMWKSLGEWETKKGKVVEWEVEQKVQNG